jgi:hypothetical protein
MEQQMDPQLDTYLTNVVNPTLARIKTALIAQQPEAANINAFIIELLSAHPQTAARSSSIELLHFNDVYLPASFTVTQ